MHATLSRFPTIHAALSPYTAIHTSPFCHPTMYDDQIVSPRYMLSHHYLAKHAVYLIAFRFTLPHLVRYPHDTYCPIRYRTIMSHLVALRYMMLLLMPYLVNLRCMLSISWPSYTFMLNLITPTMHFALSCYTRYMLPISLSHETFPNLVTPRYMITSRYML